MQRTPILVNGFSRGGTTILMNLLASHPDVCTVGEIHQIFKGSSVRDTTWQTIWKSASRDLPVILASRQDLFSPRNWAPRRGVSPRTRRFIQAILERSLRDSQHEYLNRYREPNVRYRTEEIVQSRMVGKMLDGMVYATELFTEIYPQANLVGLIRNGFAVCEGHLRRGRSAHDAGRLYRQVVTKMLTDCERFNYVIVRFEQLIADPIRQLQKLWLALGLDPFQIKYLRMQERRRMNEFGQHVLHGGREWQLRWLPVGKIGEFLDPEIDARQIRRLTAADKMAFLANAGESMERLGYLPAPVVTKRVA